MQLPELSIRRPVFACVLSLLVLLVGTIALTQLSVREYPRMDEPTVSVSASFAGASSAVVESQVTSVLESSLAAIEGVDVITSISRAEYSQVTVRFALSRDPDGAAADVRDKVNRVRQRLPQGMDEPVVAKVDADASPVIWLALSSPQHNALALSDLANRLVKPVLQTAPGAADVRVYGERRYAMRIWLDPARLAAYSLTVQDVEDALRNANVELPAGRIESAQREFNVTAATDLQTPEQFGEVVVRSVNGQTVRLAEVARVVQGPQDERSSVRLNGREAVSVGVLRQATANALELSAGVRALVGQIKASLPAGVNVEVANDSSVFIERSIAAVRTTMAEAAALVALVVFVFLRSLRPSVIALLSIPVSVVGTFALMALFGFSINTLTLLALVLAIGLVVDDSIVMLENIYRHIEQGMGAFEAALKGSREVGFAVIAMTLTLVAVYAPLAFAPGRTGRLFTEFAWVLAASVLVSGFVALTLTPMLCAKWLPTVRPPPGRFERGMGRIFERLTQGYSRALAAVLGLRWLAVLVMLASAWGSVWLWQSTKKELAPMEDRGVVLVNINGPDGATLAYTQRYAGAIERIGQQYPEFDKIFSNIGNPSVAQGSVFLRATPWEQRTRTMPDIARELTPRLGALAGVNATAITPPSLDQSARERPIHYVITTSQSYAELAAVVRQFQEALAKYPGFVQIDTDLRLNKPEIRLEVDRQRAADMGVSVGTIARTVETMLGARVVTRYKRDAQQYDVIVQTEGAQRHAPQDIEQLFVRNAQGAMVPLAALVKLQEVVVPRELNHFGQRRSASITANLSPQLALGQALDVMDSVAAEVLPAGYSAELNGQSREFRRSSDSMMLVFGLSLVFIYLVLAAQFESFVSPLIIMFSVPLSMCGALLALKLSGGTLNVFSQIGLITLVGLITKHGILIVEFANDLRRQGLSVRAAAQQAGAMRLRPILMTTGAMVLGAIPLALATGAGAQSRQHIGWVIVGGMSVGTLLTIFVVPVMYTLLSRPKKPGL